MLKKQGNYLELCGKCFFFVIVRAIKAHKFKSLM